MDNKNIESTQRKRAREINVKDFLKQREVYPEVTQTMEQHRVDQVTIGWQNAMEVAADVWKEGNFRLLAGDLVFAYKNTGDADAKLYQVVVVKYFRECNGGKLYTGKYGVSMVTAGYSYLIPETSIDYLEEVYSDLVKFKTDANIQNIFRKIIDSLK